VQWAFDEIDRSEFRDAALVTITDYVRRKVGGGDLHVGFTEVVVIVHVCIGLLRSELEL
jgi:hypothetical protein